MKGFFSFDVLNGDYPLLGAAVRNGVPTAVFGVSDAQKRLIASMFTGRIVYLTADALTAQRAAEDIRALSGKSVALLAAKDEVLTYRRAGSREALYRRLTALYEWQAGADVLVADIEAAAQLVPRRLPVFLLQAGQECEMRALVDGLVRAGYSREYSPESRGTFAVRGDVLDIFPVNAEHPVRIDFFGDEVESIKPYDEVTGDRFDKAASVAIAAATDAVVEEGEWEEVLARLHAECKRAENAAAYARMEQIVSDLEANGANDFVLPLLRNSCDLFSLLPEGTLLVFDECKLIRDKLVGMYKEHFERIGELKKGGEVMSFSQEQYAPAARMERFTDFRTVALQAFAGNTHFFEPLKIFNFTSSPARRYLGSLPDLLADIRVWRRTGYRVMLWCGTAERSAKMREALDEEGISYETLPARLSEFQTVAVLEETLEKGFLLHENKLAVIGTGDLFPKAPSARRIRRKRGDLFFAPEIGDYAVHETYGVGRVTGVERIETSDGIKEYVSLVYKDGDMLHVPVEQMDVLSKYMGGDSPSLSKIGGGEFERVKARVRASLKKLAIDLKALYAARQEQAGYVFPDCFEEMDEFIAAFPYEDTPDQASSTQEILQDMRSAKVMDRLLCGDVGFGKTEVALRAAYLCVLAGRQAVLMCPSTVLSEQHFKTASARMEPFGVRVACLNRFRSDKEMARILADLREGRVDLVVGTHRLLSQDVKFRDLGLLILDEEQRFGVEHKEKIKTYKRDVDCLTMTATPIPRTLHLSLSGIRDISTIQTPPHARLPVQTYVAEETETLIRDAVVREIARGGQVFLLYNRVETIGTYAARLAQFIPEARICTAHGRMDKATLEKNVFGFYRGEYDVLVTTTIIENGIDLPNANTLIVIDADRLGISQLYQLRGRVGRGTRLAHAYLTYKPDRILTETAAERLKAVMQFTELGSGFKVAMRDLEIRGAGNVLGAEQHGHMDKVGYELYAKILKEEITGERQDTIDLDIKATAFISEKYVESQAGRMDCYKQIADIRSLADYRRVCRSMEDTYGALPPETLNLLVIALMKSYAAFLGVKKISVGRKGGAVEFSALQALSSEGIAAAMQKYADCVGLDMTSAPVITFRPQADSQKTMVLMTNFLKFARTFT